MDYWGGIENNSEIQGHSFFKKNVSAITAIPSEHIISMYLKIKLQIYNLYANMVILMKNLGNNCVVCKQDRYSMLVENSTAIQKSVYFCFVWDRILS